MLLRKSEIAWIQQQVDVLKSAIKERYSVDVAIFINGVDDVKVIGAETIIDVVCGALHMNKVTLFGKHKGSTAVFVRYICMDFVRQYVGIVNPAAIGEIFNKDRSTVIHALQQVENLLATENKTFCDMYNKAQQAIFNNTNMLYENGEE